MGRLPQNLGIDLDPRSEEPLYTQIAAQIERRIASGALPIGHKLPPSRELAQQLGAHRNTVARAYADLERAGLVSSEVGRGTFVSAPPACAPSERRFGWSALLSQAAEAEPLGRLERLTRGAAPEGAIDLARLQPSLDLLPVEPLGRALRAALRRLGPEALAYGAREGVPRLRQLIAAYLNGRGMPTAAADVLVTSGSQQGLDLIARTLVDPGDTFLMEAETYSGALRCFAVAGARLVGVPSDAEGPLPEALERLGKNGAKGFYLMPDCHNPTGRQISEARRRFLVDWSERTGVPLIEDDFAADLDLDGPPIAPALRALDGNTIHVGTFSKKLAPALRVGFIVAPEPLRRQLARVKHAMDLGASPLLQHALAEMLERGQLAPHLARVNATYRVRRDALEAALTEHLPEYPAEHARRGLSTWLPLPPTVSAERAFDEAQRQGVLVTPSTLSAVGAGEQSGLRLSYCAEPPERLAEGARRLAAALRALRRHDDRTEPTAAPFGVA